MTEAEKKLKAGALSTKILAILLGIPLTFLIALIMLVYESWALMVSWNLLVPKVSNIGTLNLANALIINLILSFMVRNTRKGKLDYGSLIFGPIFLVLIAWVVSLFI